ncbi:hypothetical protein [Caldivirga maquilingensis]|uniref:Uncharacterized protein n=1 Tax=Caldivirga maquilingensis (strain ATCC 700844 / DSM 13496 / JCM 10307 / IC-167) TaxID=397948 RepID=A8MB22_CALMQ|nr:hypothetical protein [Caldivirga maquilingensis]ABW02651.1 hypothetical protein Cmaq_1834 [Caldivirga maquilingensis IC-167]
MLNVDELVKGLMSSCGSGDFLERIHSEVQDTIIDAAELGISNEELIKVLGIYALAQSLRLIKLNVIEFESNYSDSLSDEYVRVIQCLLKSLKGLSVECVISNEFLRRVLQYASTLVNEVKAHCISDL